MRNCLILLIFSLFLTLGTSAFFLESHTQNSIQNQSIQSGITVCGDSGGNGVERSKT